MAVFRGIFIILALYCFIGCVQSFQQKFHGFRNSHLNRGSAAGNECYKLGKGEQQFKSKTNHNAATTSLRMFTTIASANTVRAAASIPLMYALMSFNEYITHRYYQHNEIAKLPLLKNKIKLGGGGHVEHHAETLDDMTLKTDDRWRKSPAAMRLDADKYRGTAFTWEVTGLMFLQLFVTCVPALKLILNINPVAAVLMIIPSLALHTLVWNALHPWMHGLPEITWREGPAEKVLRVFRSTQFFKFLYANHEGHHVMGGLKNYNVCCPGFDHLLGTYSKESEWRPRVKAVPKIAATASQTIPYDQITKSLSNSATVESDSNILELAIA